MRKASAEEVQPTAADGAAQIRGRERHVSARILGAEAALGALTS